jgi:hypothetical protein
MIIWRGLGILVLLIAAGALFGSQFAADKAFGSGYWQQNAWPAAAGVFFAGAACWFLGRRLNKPAGKDAGEHRRTWTHDLLFVRMEWWAFPLAAVAVAMFVTGWKPGDARNTVQAASETTQKLTGSK